MSKKHYDPEFVRDRDEPDPPGEVTWRDSLSVFGLLRLFLGHTRDSSGRKNNILGVLYVSVAIFGFSMWWATHREVRISPVYVVCSTKTPRRTSVVKRVQKSTSKVAKKAGKMVRRLRRRRNRTATPKRSTTARSKGSFNVGCVGSTITVSVKPPAPTPLPASYYWVMLLFVLMFLVVYWARRPETRLWLLQMWGSWTSKTAVLSGSDDQADKELDEVTEEEKGEDSGEVDPSKMEPIVRNMPTPDPDDRH